MPKYALIAILLLAPGLALAEPGAARQDELLYRLRQDCGSCHGMTMKGGLGPALLPASLDGKPDDALVDIILNGIPGTPMPPWGFEIDRGEAAWLVDHLKRGLPDDH
jgi:cytochrome c55X